YLVLAAGYCAILDGITAALKAGKTPKELEKSVSKKYGAKDFYLEKDRVYRVENNIFEDYSAEERAKLFGKSPATVWEALKLFDENPKKTKLLVDAGIMTETDLESYKTATANIWSAELRERLVPSMRDVCRKAVKLHKKGDGSTDIDDARWAKIDRLRRSIAQDSARKKSLLTKVSDAIAKGDFDEASKLQLVAMEKIAELEAMYLEYTRNLF
ncbi:MAG: glutamine synthetase, partial [Firmicutes bacterium]|nr:glutamine synthetase [Bacillota bacterium]